MIKKLLSILGAVSLTAIGASNVISCGGGKAKPVKQQPPKEQKPVVEKQPTSDVETPKKEQEQQEKVASELSEDNFKNYNISKITIPKNEKIVRGFFDKNKNFYIKTIKNTFNNSWYILKYGETTPIEIYGINKENIIFLNVDNIGNIYYFKNEYLYKSLDYGKSWKKIYENSIFKKLRTEYIFFDNKNNLYINSYDENIGEKYKTYKLNNKLNKIEEIKNILGFKIKNHSFIKDNIILIYVDYWPIKKNINILIFKENKWEKEEIKFNNIYYKINIIKKFKNYLYFGTDNGAFVLKQGSDTPTKIEGVNYSVNSIEIINNIIYFATNSGIYEYKFNEKIIQYEIMKKLNLSYWDYYLIFIKKNIFYITIYNEIWIMKK